MSDPITINEEPYALDPQLEALDLAQSVQNLYIERAKLKNEIEHIKQDAIRDLKIFTQDLLQVADALERIIEFVPPAEESAAQTIERLQRNVESTRRALLHRLTKVQVRPMALLNTVVDEATADIEDFEVHGTLPDQTVVQEIVKGYMIQTPEGAVPLRRARVVVSRRAE